MNCANSSASLRRKKLISFLIHNLYCFIMCFLAVSAAKLPRHIVLIRCYVASLFYFCLVFVCIILYYLSRWRIKLFKAGRIALKPRLHQQQYRSNVVECYKSNDSFDKVECCFDIVAVGNNVWQNFVLSTKSKQIEFVQFVSTSSKGRNFTKNSLDIVAVWQQSRALLRRCCRCERY